MIGTLQQLSLTEWFWGVLWGGLGLLTVALVVLMQTRWGQSQPLRKCVVLSVWAHVLLAAYATTVQIFTPTPGDSNSQSIRVAAFEGALESEKPKPEAEKQRAWEQAAEPAQETASWSQPGEAEKRPLPEPVFEADTPLEPLLETVAGILPPETEAPPAEATPAPQPLPKLEPRVDTAAEPIAAPVAQRHDAPEAPVPPLVPTPDRRATPPEPVAASPEAPANNVPDALLGKLSPPPELSDAVQKPEAQAALPALEDSVGRASSPLAAEQVAVEPALVPVAPAVPELEQMPVAPVVPSLPPALAPGADSLVPHLATAGPTPGIPAIPAYQARAAADRLDIVRRHGGSEKTEQAVQAALKWLATNQSEDGRWNPRLHGGGREMRTHGHDRGGAGAHADNGMTGLALLAFLGAGHTHERGPYATNVKRGLEFLIANQADNGYLGGNAERFARMYCHGMASLALSEAYGMTRDPKLEQPLRRAVSYTLSAQHPSNGGWRYHPGDLGDTSQLGWQWMVLSSAQLAGIDVPPKVSDGVQRYLDSVSAGFHRGLASYRMGEGVNRPMTAEALVCRQLLGMTPADPAAQEAGDYLLGELPGSGRANFYYWYYGSMAMFQLQGRHWQRWNDALTETLLPAQHTVGPLAGSWDPNDVWGGYGGRVYSTALATLSLEVYYRYLPLYTLANDKAAQWR